MGDEPDEVQSAQVTDGTGAKAAAEADRQSVASENAKKDWSDRLGSVTTFIASVIIGGAGVLSTHLYNNSQLELKRLSDDAELKLKDKEIDGQIKLKEKELDGQITLKDREETRHTKVELSEALDKYAHYLFSKDPKEREVGYALMTSIGFPDLALKIGQYTADDAITKLAEIQSKNPDLSIQNQAVNTLATLSGKQRDTIIRIIRRFEGTDYDTVRADSDGSFLYGVGPFLLQSGDLEKLLTKYSTSPGAKYAQDLSIYVDRIKNKDIALARDNSFLELLKKAGADSVMRQAQDESLNEYLNKSLVVAQYIELKQPLSIEIINDARYMSGEGTVRKLVGQATTDLNGSPATGVDEKTWIRKFLDLELVRYQSTQPQLVGLQNRVKFFIDLVSKDDWLLESAAAKVNSN